MNKTTYGEENLYYELESVKKVTEANIYDDVAGETAVPVTQQTSFEKYVQGAKEKRQPSTQHEYASQCNTVVLRRMLFVIAAVAAVALLVAIATLILALTAMKPRNDSTAKVQADFDSSGAIKSEDYNRTEMISENLTTLIKKMEGRILQVEQRDILLNQEIKRMRTLLQRQTTELHNQTISQENNTKELEERLASTQLELKTVDAQLDGQLAGLWNATNSTTAQLSRELRNVWKTVNAIIEKASNLTDKEKVIYHQTMTPSWLEAHASYIDSYYSKTTGQLTFNAGSSSIYAALLKVPMIPAGVLQYSSPLTVKIVVSNDVTIGKSEDSDMSYGVSDGISFVGFQTVDKSNYGNNFPCYGLDGSSGAILTGRRYISQFSPRRIDSFYPGQFVFTLKLDEHWGSCYIAHDGGFVKTAAYNNRLMLNKGLTLEVYKDDKGERVGIKYIEVTIIQDA